MKLKLMGLFMFQKTVSMTFFTDHCAWNFFFTRVCFLSIDFLWFCLGGKPMLSPFVNLKKNFFFFYFIFFFFKLLKYSPYTSHIL